MRSAAPPWFPAQRGALPVGGMGDVFVKTVSTARRNETMVSTAPRIEIQGC